MSNIWNLLLPVSMVVNTIDKDCQYYQQLDRGHNYYIFNKEYPQNYSAGSSCQWIAKSPKGSKIFLSCDDVTMPKSSKCIQDRIDITFSGSTNLSESHKYCGEGSFSLITEENMLSLTLKTSKRSPGGRFLCAVTALMENTTQMSMNEFAAPNVQPSCQCGWKNDKRIVGGEETLVNEYPAMAGLITRNGKHLCGATIISSRYVITAAHCVYNTDVNTLFLLVGDHDYTTGTDTGFSAIYRVKAYEMWDGYNPSNFQGDIAIVMVDKINFNDNVGPICLPFRYTYETFEREEVTAVGWGQLEFSGQESNVLREVDLEVISNAVCRQDVPSLIDSQMCTFTEGKDACQGDSGGPLFWQNPTTKKLFIVGIISKGLGCGSAVPSENTRVTSYLEWIQRRTGEFFCSA
uniref:Trypsin-like serine proteinase n=2 Tax=Anthonomus grandis TaxID=7044 RepID=Q64ID3_ANTGR|nr:trypsin-like serine proteinase [Anthonomus grandis]